MNAPPPTSCRAYRDALMLVACGDAALDDLSAEAAEHLAVCGTCRAELADARRMTELLSAALTPAPLLPALTDRIVNEAIGRPSHGVDRRRVNRLAWAQGTGFAAAAMVLLACFLPRSGTPRVATAVGLTEAEQLDLLAAYASLQWDGPIEYSIDRVDDVLADVSQRLDALADELEGSPPAPDGTPPDSNEPPLDHLPAQSSAGTAYCAAAPTNDPVEIQR